MKLCIWCTMYTKGEDRLWLHLKIMTLKEIREYTGLSQSRFSLQYEIPLDTVKSWEAAVDSARYRQCPDYVKKLLLFRVLSDYSPRGTTREEIIGMINREV